GTLSIGDQTLTVTQAGSTYVPAGTVTVLFGEGELLQQPQGVSVDREGNVYATDINYNNVTEWPPAHYNDWTILAFHGLFQPGGVAVDGVGNVYVADSGNNAIKEWIAASNNVVTLVSSGLYLPQGVALDGASNVYIADSYNSEIKEWTAANGNVTTLVSSGLSYPYGLAVDAAGNVYIADSGNNAIKEWIAANSNVITLVSTGLNSPLGVAVDGAGNVYIADSENFAVKKWTAANNSVTTLVSNDVGFLPYVPQGVAVDEAGDVFFANTYSSETIDELPYALVDLAPKVESAAGGNDSLPVVLPTTADLFPPLFPTASDRPWLVITGVTNGVVSFSVAANPGLPRIGKITMLGKSVPVVQVSGGSPKNLIALPTDGDRACAFAFGDTNNASFTVLSSTNLSAPPSGWTVVGVASNTAPQLYEFTDAQPTNDQRYYRIRSP
ncbi:MAG TPA: hypothetical protein VK731_11555, partial [Candidatus Cybelea sp.]|nr:hypothetical protein [Candidatus Cybelea sp.]